MKLGTRRSYLKHEITGFDLPKKLYGVTTEQYNVKFTSSGRESPSMFCKWKQACQSLTLDNLRSYLKNNYKPYTLLSTQNASNGVVLNLKLTPHPDSFCTRYGDGCSDTVVHLLIEPAIDIRI